VSRLTDPDHYQHASRANRPRPYGEGDKVTVVPLDEDPVILHMQRYAKVVRDLASGYLVEVGSTHPPAIFGPIPAERLLPGWRDERGQWRRW
jgi:hypothetical protein